MDFIGAFLNNKLDIKLYIKVFKNLYKFNLSNFKVLNLLKQYS